jgi:hypothetical protein
LRQQQVLAGAEVAGRHEGRGGIEATGRGKKS